MSESNKPSQEILQIKQVDGKRKERIAEREQHESSLQEMLDGLKKSGFLRKATLIFPNESAVGRLLKRNKWPKGAERYVARANVQYDTGTKMADQDNDDQYYQALVTAGYRVIVWPDFDQDDVLEYYIYESSK